MDTIKLCTCNNCGTVYIDTNPGDDSIDYNSGLITLFEIEELPYIIFEDEDKGHGCNKLTCMTDGYLVDNVNGWAGGMAEELHIYLYE